MKSSLLALLAIFISFCSRGQLDFVYHKDYGNPEYRTLLFFHDGPGGNCAEFEAKMVPELLNYKYHVVVYDRRGEGRSDDPAATHSKDEMIGDIKLLNEVYHFKDLTIVAEGFGAILAKVFVESAPFPVEFINFINVPKDQATFVRKNMEGYAKNEGSPAFKANHAAFKSFSELDPSSFNYLASYYGFRRNLECTSKEKGFVPSISEEEKTRIQKFIGDPVKLNEWMCKSKANLLPIEDANLEFAQFELYPSMTTLSTIVKNVNLFVNTQASDFDRNEIDQLRSQLANAKIKEFDSKNHDLINVYSKEIVEFIALGR
jgi:pimeloyl-ACP methyl ester carboxylesterase